MTDFIQVTTTTAKQDDAQRIAQSLVERRLAACVQVVGPIASTFRWLESIENTQEWLCLIKTSRDLYPAVESAIRELHEYDVPEIIAVPIVDGIDVYLNWLRETTQPPPE